MFEIMSASQTSSDSAKLWSVSYLITCFPTKCHFHRYLTLFVFHSNLCTLNHIETQYVVERALFSTQKFIEFTTVIPAFTVGMNGTELFSHFLDSNLISSPQFDGILQIISSKDSLDAISSNFVFRNSENQSVSYSDLSDPDLSNIAQSLLTRSGGTGNGTNCYFIGDAVVEGADYDEDEEDGSIWFITWRAMDLDDLGDSDATTSSVYV